MQDDVTTGVRRGVREGVPPFLHVVCLLPAERPSARCLGKRRDDAATSRVSASALLCASSPFLPSAALFPRVSPPCSPAPVRCEHRRGRIARRSNAALRVHPCRGGCRCSWPSSYAYVERIPPAPQTGNGAWRMICASSRLLSRLGAILHEHFPRLLCPPRVPLPGKHLLAAGEKERAEEKGSLSNNDDVTVRRARGPGARTAARTPALVQSRTFASGAPNADEAARGSYTEAR